MSELVYGAFTALGSGATRREIELVAAALREADDPDTIALLDAASLKAEDRRGFDQLVAIAIETEAGPFVALDLVTEWAHPGCFRERGLSRDPRPELVGGDG